MLRVVIEKEIRDILVSTRFAIAFGLAAVLIILSFYTGATGYLSNARQYEASKAGALRQVERLKDWEQLRAYHIFLPPDPLASLVSGVANDIGRNTAIAGRGDVNPTDSRFSEDPVFAVFRFVDLEFIFGVVLSLCALVLGHDAICGEKERGTLRLSMANAVPRSQLILGKTIGLFLALAIPLLLAFGLGILVFLVLGVPMEGDQWLRLILIIPTGLLYVSAFLVLSVLVSALTTRSSSSFLALLVIWIACVLIIPRSAVLLAGRAVSVPSVDELMSQEGQLNTQLGVERLDKLATFRSTPGRPVEEQVAQFEKFMDSLTTDQKVKVNALTARLEEERYNRQQEQQTLAFGLARLSPTSSLSLSLTSLAATSLSLQSQYLASAREYQQSFAKFIAEKTGQQPFGGAMRIRIGGPPEDDKEKKVLNASELPAFDFHRESLDRCLANALPDIGLLILFNLIFFAGAFVAFQRYDLR
jgi:ABC-type transport system involved in multi-copper enzyme maturation permease subunit